MNKAWLIALVVALTLLGGQTAVAEGHALVLSSSFAVRAALKADFLAPATGLQLHTTPGQAAVVEGTLRVGTNDWPLDLHLGILSEQGSVEGATLLYRFTEEPDPASAWVAMTAFSEVEPVAQLPSPAWTDYSLAVRVTPPDGTPSGSHRWAVRVLLRSRSGQVATVEFPVTLTVP